jgi:hypothetical protein
MRRAEIVAALVLLVVAAIGFGESIRLGAGWGDSGPRGGFFLFWLSVILTVSTLTILVQAVRLRGGGAAAPFFPPGAIRLVLTVFLPMAVTFLLMEVVGFYVAALIYLLVYIRLTGHHTWATAAAVAVLFPGVIFLVFERWFLIPLPKGFFGELLLPFF